VESVAGALSARDVSVHHGQLLQAALFSCTNQISAGVKYASLITEAVIHNSHC